MDKQQVVEQCLSWKGTYHKQTDQQGFLHSW
jgi:hypothetical protein